MGTENSTYCHPTVVAKFLPRPENKASSPGVESQLPEGSRLGR